MVGFFSAPYLRGVKFTILHRDEDLVLVDKPAGLLSVPDRHDPDVPNLKHLLGERLGAPVLPVHRLDRYTSGLLVFARTAEAHRSLSQQFAERQVEKVYLAIVDGVPAAGEATIDEPIAPHPARVGQMMVSARGKFARTDYKVMEPLGQFSLLGVQIFTGRTHQIRVHLAYLGHPLLVDPQYGKRTEFRLSELKGRRYNLGRGREERPLLGRLPLHAERLAFTHPGTGEWVAFRRELPKDMRATLNQLRKLG